MERGDFQGYFKRRYKKQIEWYAGKARRYKKLYHLFQWSVIVLSAITPVLVALSAGGTIRWLTVAVSSLVAIGTTSLKTFKYQEKWINYRTTAETLKKEEYFYKAGAGAYQEARDPESLFVERVENLISRENTLWLIAVREKSGQNHAGVEKAQNGETGGTASLS